MNPLATCAVGTGFTFTVSAAIEILEPRLLGPYLGTCAVVYGAAGAVVAVRQGWAELLHQIVTERLTGPAAPSFGDWGPCESCLVAPAIRQVITNGEPFAVCQACTPPTPVVMTATSSTH